MVTKSSDRTPKKKPATKKKAAAAKTASTKLSEETKKPIRAPGTSTAVNRAILDYQRKLLGGADLKLQDYVQLLKLKKELDAGKLKEVTVRWVNPWEKADSTEE